MKRNETKKTIKSLYEALGHAQQCKAKHEKTLTETTDPKTAQHIKNQIYRCEFFVKLYSKQLDNLFASDKSAEGMPINRQN